MWLEMQIFEEAAPGKFHMQQDEGMGHVGISILHLYKVLALTKCVAILNIKLYFWQVTSMGWLRERGVDKI